MPKIYPEPVTIKNEGDLTEQGLYYVESTDRLMLMVWEGQQLKVSGFVTRAGLREMGANEEEFIKQWLKDTGCDSDLKEPIDRGAAT